jgi:hypothetical protein
MHICVQCSRRTSIDRRVDPSGICRICHLQNVIAESMETVVTTHEVIARSRAMLDVVTQPALRARQPERLRDHRRRVK